jgi:hypothetical protein
VGVGMLPSVFLCCVASVIEFASAADTCEASDSCGHSRHAFGIAVGVVSTLMCAIRLLLAKLSPELPQKVGEMNTDRDL